MIDEFYLSRTSKWPGFPSVRAIAQVDNNTLTTNIRRLTAAAIGLPLDFLKLMVSTKTIGAVKAGTTHTNLEEGEDGGGGKSIRSACKF